MSERPTLELSADQVRADGEAFLITMPGRLTRNAAQCLACGNTIESIHRRDYRMCGCPNGTMVDGGLAYQRWGAVDPSQIRDLSEHGPPPVLVALNQPCPTCGGMGQKTYGYVEDGDRETYTCPDCGGSGRLVFDLKVDGYRPETDQYHVTVASRRVWLDPEWGILPIIHNDNTPWLSQAPFVETWDDDRSVLWLFGDPVWSAPIVLPPAARPGDYVARAVEVTS